MQKQKRFTTKDGRYILTKDLRTIFFDNSQKSWPGLAKPQKDFQAITYVTLNELSTLLNDAKKRLKGLKSSAVVGRIDSVVEFFIYKDKTPHIKLTKEKLIIAHPKRSKK